MDIVEKSKEYAKGKALDAITSAIEQAYAKGYEAGYNDAVNRNMADNQGIVLIDGLEYVDLNLPSGTLWSKDSLEKTNGYSIYLTYYEAAKLKIPTPQQFDELERCCEKIPIENKGRICGFRYMCRENGAFIDLHYCGGYKGSEPISFGSFAFWVRGWGVKNPDNAMIATIKGTIQESVDIKLPVRMVTKKKS